MEEKYNIIAIGSQEFIMGFKLAGLNAIEADENPTEKFKELLKNKEIGIIVTDDKTINLVGEKVKQETLESVKPVTVVLSLENSGQEALQKMIKKSLGVDLWK